MGIYDRYYTQDNYQPHTRFQMPGMTPAVKWLLIINVAVFAVEVIGGLLRAPIQSYIEQWFAVFPINLFYILQVWRYVTYQFLHDGLFHILFNMVALFFFGTFMERLWGTRRFLIFYLTCGAIGGIVYPLFVLMGVMTPGILVGASGAILGLLAAGAILFPKMRVYVYGIFPIPFAVMAVIVAVMSMMALLSGQNSGGELAHLAGMAAGAAFVLFKPLSQKQKVKTNTQNRAWEKKLQKEREFEQRVNEVLDKVRDKGIHSLSGREKKILQQATQREREQNRA